MKFLKPIELYHESLKTTGRLIGLSVSKKNLGVSVSDDSKTKGLISISQTLAMTKNPLSALRDMISQYSVSGLVIGYPFRIEENEKIEKRYSTVGLQAKKLIDDLNISNFEDMNYTVWDSSYTTKMLFLSLKQKVKSMNFTPSNDVKISESYAAFEILQGCFDAIINKSDDRVYFDLINRDNPF